MGCLSSPMTTTRVRLRLLDGAVCCTGGKETMYGRVAGAIVAGAAAALLGLLTLGTADTHEKPETQWHEPRQRAVWHKALMR